MHPRLTPGQAGLEFIAARSCGWLPEAPEGPRAGDKRVSARKLLLRELTDLLERMDEEDLQALLKFARTLAE